MPKEEKNKIIASLREDGIIFVDITKASSPKDVDLSFSQTKDIVSLHKDKKNKAKILVHMATDPLFRTSSFRKDTAIKINDLIKMIGQVKSALYAESIIARTVSSFIMMASGSKDWKVFRTKENAIKWLKKP